ncbi:hypothetical protein AVEN_4111-1 [Araneus ventricosus]|uniref:Uncharacterized protein n=1 Tax=Araneus ventricosus TaxID=182803 RepID=A0A4Y2QRR2_ARAVE|nr:hypothetical protein AVEN_4111-1 [Araneus ventricosus]
MLKYLSYPRVVSRRIRGPHIHGNTRPIPSQRSSVVRAWEGKAFVPYGQQRYTSEPSALSPCTNDAVLLNVRTPDTCRCPHH